MHKILPILIAVLMLGAGSRDFRGGSNNDVVNFGTDAKFDIAGDNGSWGGWINIDAAPPSSGNEFMVISKGGGTDAYKLRIDENRRVECVADLDTIRVLTDGSFTVNNDEWVHVMCRNNGTDLKIFINGVDEASAADTGDLDQDAADHLCIGINSADGGCDTDRDMNGQIGWAFLSDRALEDQGVNEVMWRPQMLEAYAQSLLLAPLWGYSTERDLTNNPASGTVTGALTSDTSPPVFLGNGLPL